LPLNKKENGIIKISQKFSLKYLVYAVVLNSLILIPYVFFDFIGGSYTELFFAFLFIFCTISSAVILQKLKMQKFGEIIFTSIFSLLWILLFLKIERNNFALIFFLVYPQVITVLLYYKHALIVNIAMFLIYCVIFSIDFDSGTISIMNPLSLRIGSVFLMNLIIVYFWKRNSTDKMDEINTIALYDSLTGVANKKHFEIYIEKIIDTSRHNNRKFSLLFLDIDNFKKINDSPGHEVGNKVIREIAGRINRCLDGSDSLFRIGGDEFVAVIPDINDDFAPALLARKILSAEDPLLHLPTMSIGIVNFPEDGGTGNELIQKSEIAMYKAKKNGKNTFSFFHKEFNRQLKKRILIEKNLRLAQMEDEFSVVFQPKIESEEEQIVGAEALIRWNNPSLGNISPSDFISIAEDCDIIHKMSSWVYKKAFKMLSKIQEAGHRDFILSINVSPVQISKNTLINSLNAALKETGVSPECIELEITEGILLGADGNSNETLRYLRQQGFRMAIDDFGTGYSSLSYLQNLSLDTIKIDKSFISSIHEKNVQSITTAIISLANSINLQTIAEGVETEEQLEILRGMGCNLIQGYYFSKAISDEDFFKLLSGTQVK